MIESPQSESWMEGKKQTSDGYTIVSWHYLKQLIVLLYPYVVGLDCSSFDPQGEVDVKDSVWSVECTFGNEQQLDGSYNLIAVLGDELKDKTYSDLPGNLPDGAVTSDLVSVQRQRPDKTQVCPNHRLHQIEGHDRQH